MPESAAGISASFRDWLVAVSAGLLPWTVSVEVLVMTDLPVLVFLMMMVTGDLALNGAHPPELEAPAAVLVGRANIGGALITGVGRARGARGRLG